LINVISSIGGVNAFFGPLLNILTPFLGLKFLYELSEIIKERINKEYLNKMKKFMENAIIQIKFAIENS